ncbi:MAG: hypothetical protein ABS76_35765 [Pelagibacterium sp. SCN 64-44]|nr:MAG: hypothetical protein ABS76_35765 [Pelagibacterium sp. SCN 64-44]
MRQNGAARGSVQRAAAAAFSGAWLLALGATTALAGDRAGIDLIGYSPDMSYFAFEEFGIQDGSGFAYSSVFILELPTDMWVKGSPIRVRLEEDGSSLSQARRIAAEQARSLLDDHGITEPAMMLALNGDGEAADFTRLEAGWPGYGLDAPRDSFGLELESFEAPSKAACADYTDEPVLGFALTLTRDGERSEIYRDERIPTSRGCPLAYRLYGVAAPFTEPFGADADRQAGLVALVSVYSLGFEGPDRRFIAVPLG